MNLHVPRSTCALILHLCILCDVYKCVGFLSNDKMISQEFFQVHLIMF